MACVFISKLHAALHCLASPRVSLRLYAFTGHTACILSLFGSKKVLIVKCVYVLEVGVISREACGGCSVSKGGCEREEIRLGLKNTQDKLRKCSVNV